MAFSGRIFNIGLNRAGSRSLGAALERLGYRAAHCRHEGRKLYEIAIENLRAGRRAFDGIDHRYDAFLDFAGYNFFHLVDRAYPGSRFIVTYRDLESWLASREKLVRRNRSNASYTGDFLQVERDQWAKQRATFLLRVKAYFRGRPGDVLVLNIPEGDGWAELCPFLDCAVPDAPFPHRNASARWVRTEESE